MKKTLTVFILVFATLASLCIPVHCVYAGQASATATVIIIIPARETATQTQIVQEEKTEQQNQQEDTQVAYAKN
ncbi:MAG TPA: hypothetical protein VMD52_06650 [Patescibacteria group bacterium]|nr:hypothetical protein [Patescibacteria group bacterium]